ncbi:MAG: NAD+ synthase [Dehalogenimonas sp.]|uniref:Glutamine-dependent NAD(+) synthetase n=1 Tax=Candidatus Dehalogenimonas loeffleri TaxID=3127115 RepID=A0ABZ2J312_9CHLR|nr:NAD+ synthase [Dehalogenimonas sp.]
MKKLRLAQAQINTTVGDFSGNVRLISEYLIKARDAGADLVVFPEMTVCGYPPEDLLLKPGFIAANGKAMSEVAAVVQGITAVVGFVDCRPEGLFNAAAVIQDGQITGIYHKIHLPNYGVFDEQRYFQPGQACPVFTIRGVKVGLNVCEDIWRDNGPTAGQAAAGAELILNISASPYHHGKYLVREQMLKSRALDHGVSVAFCNLVGGQDELVFDGASLVVDRQGTVIARAGQFNEELLITDLSVGGIDTDKSGLRRMAGLLEPDAEVYQALVTGTRDYITKNGFQHVIIGLSGGLDSSLVAAVAVDAVGAEHVNGLIMPSRFSSPVSAEYAGQLAANLGIKVFSIPIEEVYSAYLDNLAGVFTGLNADVTEENIQARIRGNLLMALSNKFGWLVLNTGNKSEVATGYTTLYGDMAGGFAVIKDVPKTLAYELCKHRNRQAGRDLIPQAIINRAPSAELRPEQKDSDSLPPYDVLDPILSAYVEEDRSVPEIIAQGYDAATVRRIARLVDSSEYKRRQSPPGVKITPKAFGRDRRLPITNKFRGA